jgi:hypothetical protein
MRNDEISIETRYSITTEPDKQGRWMRKLIFDNRLHIATVNSIKTFGDVKYQLCTQFPVTMNDMPHHRELFDTADEAIKFGRWLWDMYRNILQYPAPADTTDYDAELARKREAQLEWIIAGYVTLAIIVLMFMGFNYFGLEKL